MITNLINIATLSTNIYKPPKRNNFIKTEKKEVKVENVEKTNRNHFDTRT